MLDLQTEAIASWLTSHGSEDLARSTRASRTDDDPGLASALAALGTTLEASARPDTKAFEEVFDSELPASMAEVIAHLGPGRRLRLLHWLTEVGFDQLHRVIEQLTDPGTPGGTVVLQWITQLLRRERLDRLFSQDRIETLLTACRKAKNQEMPS